MKPMKKSRFFLILPLAVVIGLVFTNCEIKNKQKPSQKQLAIAKKKDPIAEKKKWEASPDGIMYKKWEDSPEGKKVSASYYKISKNIEAFSDMEAVVTSVTFQRENASPSGPKWLIVKIGDEDYMMQFVTEEFEKLKSLKVNDKIIVKSRSAGCSPNHPYLIISSDYIAKDNKVLYKRDLSKNNGC